jgi:hypothetical protein
MMGGFDVGSAASTPFHAQDSDAFEAARAPEKRNQVHLMSKPRLDEKFRR